MEANCFATEHINNDYYFMGTGQPTYQLNEFLLQT